VHDGKKKEFCCGICPANYSRKESLNIHIETVHEGKKPFKCSLCDTNFPRKAELTKHKLSIHGGGSIQCPMCDCAFSDKLRFEKHNALAAHMSSVHNHTDYRDSKNAAMFLETQLVVKENITDNQQVVQEETVLHEQVS